ncbi:hypothetical protein K4732_21245 (plasmid) [Pantoea ananatis]|uniref:FimD/PapC C-terminal domain-containing protein n=1 Tax=Pantoea ananas TaxID=553 RepID=UPI001C893B82|nr:FimD/PapC C-terminal domain-containing protein [Pantoea ananatis]QZE31375.1 hypothetical protein K4732_21245 [Pantoea ananatis]
MSDKTSGGGVVIGRDAGHELMSGLKLKYKLKVVWGHAASQQCTVIYQLGKDVEKRGIIYAHTGRIWGF